METIEKFTWPNGMQLWVKPRPGTGTVAASIKVPVGARHESREKAGISHFLEHMLFSCNSSEGALGLLRKTEEYGAILNASTSVNNTEFFCEGPLETAHEILDLLLSIVFEPKFNQMEIERERRIVMNEMGNYPDILSDIREWVNNRGWSDDLQSHIVATFWGKNSPDNKYPIGRKRNIKRFTIEEIRAWYDTYYVPSNLFMVVVGDCDPATVYAQVDAFVGSLPNVPTPPPPPPIVPQKIKKRTRIFRKIADHPQIFIGLPWYGQREQNFPAGNILVSLLSKTLNEKLRHELALVYHVVLMVRWEAEAGLLLINIDANNGRDLKRIEKEAFAIIDKLYRGEFSDEEVESMKRVKRLYDRMNYVGNLAQTDLFYPDCLYHAPSDPPPDYFAEHDSVTSEALRALAQAQLGRQNWVVLKRHVVIQPWVMLVFCILALIICVGALIYLGLRAISEIAMAAGLLM